MEKTDTSYIAFHLSDAAGDVSWKVRIHSDGRVEIAEGLSAEDAVLAVWTAIHHSLPAYRAT